MAQNLHRLHQVVGFRRTLLEACLYVLYSASGKLLAMILVEVDDLLVAADPSYLQKLRAMLQSMFIFGKLVENEAAVTFAERTL